MKKNGKSIKKDVTMSVDLVRKRLKRTGKSVKDVIVRRILEENELERKRRSVIGKIVKIVKEGKKRMMLKKREIEKNRKDWLKIGERESMKRMIGEGEKRMIGERWRMSRGR